MATFDIRIKKHDEVFSEVSAPSYVLDRIEDALTFSIPQFRPKARGGAWNKTFKLFHAQSPLIYNGLISKLAEIAKKYKYTIEPQERKEPSVVDLEQFISALALPVTPHDYQIDAVKKCIKSGRQLVLSPTSSGKSLQIFLLTKWFAGRTLIIVPRATLTTQFRDEFIYCGESPDNIQLIGDGRPIDPTKKIVIALWQSIWRLPEQWYTYFDNVIGDEVHTFNAKSLVTLMEKTGTIKTKFGFTGTLDENEYAEARLIGLFGPIIKTVSTLELMERGVISKFRIKVVLLSYPESEIAPTKAAKMAYIDEIAFLTSSKLRNAFIAKLATSLAQNTIVLFSNIETHGDILLKEIKKLAGKKPVFYIHGGIPINTRDEIKEQIRDATESILLASKATFATGENIKAIHNCVFASPSKGKIINLQAIGRGLRLHETKTEFIVFDIADDLRYKGKINPTFKHLQERLKIYKKEGFSVSLIKHRLG